MKKHNIQILVSDKGNQGSLEKWPISKFGQEIYKYLIVPEGKNVVQKQNKTKIKTCLTKVIKEPS